MNDFILSLHYYANLIFFFCAPIIGIIFWKKQRTKESLIFTLGILLIWLRYLIMTFVNLRETFMHDIEKIHELSLIWFNIGTVVYSIGLIVTVFGFALVTWKMKRNT